MKSVHSLNPETLVTHVDREMASEDGIAPAIYQTSTFFAASAEEFQQMASTPRHNRNYTRDGNPTFTRAERIIAELEGAESALLTASGMGAISSTVLALVGQGDHVVAQKNHYMGTTQLLSTLLPKFGVAVTYVDQARPAEFAAALRPTTRLIMVESPSNPLLKLTDLHAVSELARPRGIVTVCDGTIGTPINQRPLEAGIDLVVHSATKFLGGHHDLMAGVVAGSAELIERVWHSQVILGPVPDPFAAWLLTRGLRTLPLRVRRQNETALAVANYLEAHPEIGAVNYPGLNSHPQHDLARRQMPGGFSGLMSFELRGGFEASQRVMDALTLPSRAVSFGGFESLISHPAGMWGGVLGIEKAKEAGISPSLVRFSVGLEHPDDVIADLAQALSALKSPNSG